MPHDPTSPEHYALGGGLEARDVILRTLGTQGFRAYCIGNILKYRLRAGRKGSAAEDLAKADVYASWVAGIDRQADAVRSIRDAHEMDDLPPEPA